MELSLKSLADIGCCAAEPNEDAARRNPIHLQTLCPQPGSHSGDVIVGEPKALADFVR